MNGWQITTPDQGELLITGPGRLEIVVRPFEASRVERPEDLGAAVLGTLMQRCWRYEVEPGLWIELISTADTVEMDRPEQHRLHLGRSCSWQVPDAFAEALHAQGPRP